MKPMRPATPALLSAAIAAALAASVAAAPLAPPARAAAPAQTAPASHDEVSLARAKVQFADANYKDCLATIARLQELRGAAADGLDRSAMFLLKAEAHMQQNEPAMVTGALGNAIKEASDPAARMQAESLDLLVRRSPGFKFTPRTGDRDRHFDILKPAERKSAMLALLADELDAVRKRFPAAKTTKSLAELAEFCRTLPLLRAVEIAATDKSAAVDEMVKVLRERFYVVLDGDLSVDETKVKQIAAAADKPTTVRVLVNNRPVNQTQRTGLSANDVTTLKAVAVEHEKTRATMDDLQALLAVTPEAIKTRQTRNDTLLTLINTLLTTDFTKPAPKPKRPGG